MIINTVWFGIVCSSVVHEHHMQTDGRKINDVFERRRLIALFKGWRAAFTFSNETFLQLLFEILYLCSACTLPSAIAMSRLAGKLSYPTALLARLLSVCTSL